MRIECPKCDARIQIDDDEDGRVACPKCGVKFRLAQDEVPKSAKKSGKKAGKRKDEEEDDDDEKKSPVVAIVAGGVGLLTIAGIVLAVVFLGGKKDKEKDKETASSTPATTEVQAAYVPPPPFVSRPNDPNPTNPAPPPPLPGKDGKPPDGKFDGQPGLPPEIIIGPYAALFRQEIPPNLPPKVRGASLKPTSADKEPEIPSFHSLMMARKDAKDAKNPNPLAAVIPKNAKLTLEELKKACCYIKVEASGGGGSGSGFLISTNGSTGLVATNHHVIADAAEARYGNVNAKVSVVFNSGLADEHSHKADIVAFDPVADVAILRIESAKEWPKVLNPYHTPSKLVEGTAIQFWGFPLGGILASGKKNPEITLGTGSISSFRHNDSGKMERVQISGTMNPGNSGGPIVDTDGRLVGVAVSIVNPQLGTGIGFAVPVNDLIALLEGKLLRTIFIPLQLEKDQAAFIAVAPIMDPMDRINTVFVRRWAGSKKPPEAIKDPLTGYKPFAMQKDGKANLPGTEEFPLKKLPADAEDLFSGLGLAIGELTVPLDSEQVLLQVASQTIANPQTGVMYTAASKPVSYTLKVEDLPVASDVRPLSELTANPEGLTGRVVVVRARIAGPPLTRDVVQDLLVIDVDGKPTKNTRFLVTRELASQFDEVEREHQPLPVRLVCLVGTRGPDGYIPVRIARIDFIGRSQRIVRSIPGPPLEDVELANLNRDPAKFTGQSVTMKCGIVPYALKSKGEAGEIRLTLSGGSAPRNLKFTITNAMFVRMLEKMGPDVVRPDSIASARITTAPVPKPVDPRIRTAIPITKIEFLGAEDKVVATIE